MTIAEIRLSTQAANWMQEEIDSGLGVEEASQKAWERCKREGIAMAFADLEMPLAIRTTWANRHRSERRSLAESVPRREPTPPVLAFNEDDFVDPRMLLHSQVKVGNRWMSIGECAARHFVLLAEKHEKVATTNNQRAAAYRMFAEKAGEKALEEVVTEEEAQAIWRMAHAE